MNDVERTRVALVGAGPIGIEVAIHLRKEGIPYVHLDKTGVASTIATFPPQMTFFSSTDRLALAGHPIQTVGQQKCTKEEYLAYLRSLVIAHDLDVRCGEEVVGVERHPGGGFLLTTRSRRGEGTIRADRLVLATGGTDRPRRLGIPGEDLPHVRHRLGDPHATFRQRVLIVGGRNSAVEAALRCWHVGARVALSYRRGEFDARHVKYWLLPELQGRIARGEIAFHALTRPTAVTPTHVRLEPAEGEPFDVEADHVLLLTGYVADMRLFERAGVTLSPESRAPRYDERTMETDVPGLFVAGTAIAGTQSGYRVFIENCHVHAARIAAALAGRPPPPEPAPLGRPES